MGRVQSSSILVEGEQGLVNCNDGRTHEGKRVRNCVDRHPLPFVPSPAHPAAYIAQADGEAAYPEKAWLHVELDGEAWVDVERNVGRRKGQHAIGAQTKRVIRSGPTRRIADSASLLPGIRLRSLSSSLLLFVTNDHRLLLHQSLLLKNRTPLRDFPSLR